MSEVPPLNEVQPRFCPPAETRVPMNRPGSLTPVSVSNPAGDGMVVVKPFQLLMTPISAQVTSPLLRTNGPPRMPNTGGVARTAGAAPGVQRTTASWENGCEAVPTA